MLKGFRIYLLLLVFLTIGCEKEIERMDDFFVEFATVKQYPDKVGFVLDNYRELLPENAFQYSGEDGQRVILNYTPVMEDIVRINSLSDVYTSNIIIDNDIDFSIIEKVKLQSVWVGGDYLNIIFEAEFYEKNPSVGVLLDSNSEGINLYFAFKRNGDSPGYQRKFYTSFALDLIISDSEDNTPFKFYIDTYDGLKEYSLVHQRQK